MVRTSATSCHWTALYAARSALSSARRTLVMFQCLIRTSPGCLSLWRDVQLVMYLNILLSHLIRAGLFFLSDDEDLICWTTLFKRCWQQPLCVCFALLHISWFSSSTAVPCRCVMKYVDARSNCCVMQLFAGVAAGCCQCCFQTCSTVPYFMSGGLLRLDVFTMTEPRHFHTLHHKALLNPTTHRLSDLSD